MRSPASPASRLSTAISAIRSRVACVAERDVGHHQQARRVQQRMVARQRLGVGHVERRAGDRARVQGARASAPVSTIGPRAVFTR